MNEHNTEAASPASKNGDEQSGNVSLGQAAAMLFAKEQSAVPPSAPAPTTDKTPPEEPTAPEETPQSVETAELESETSDSEAVEGAVENPEPETDEQEEAALSQKTSSDKETRIREKVQKRVDEEVAKRKVLEERIANLESSLKAKTSQPLPKGTLPLSEYNDLTSLGQYELKAKQAARWAKDQLARDDISEGVQVEDKVLDRDQIRNVLREAEIALEDHIPARKDFLNARMLASRQAVEMFPFLKDSNSEDYQAAVQAYRLNPWLQDLPNADFIVGVQVEGLKALRSRQEAASKPKVEKPKPKPIPASKPAGDQVAVSSGTTTPRVPTASAARNALEAQRAKLSTKGAVTASEAAALLERSDKLRNLR